MQTIRVSLPTYNALTDNDPDHYAIRADEDNILIKELTRGSFNIGSGSNASYSHNLGYIPLVMAYFDTGAGKNWVYGDGIFGFWQVYITDSIVKFFNFDGSTRRVQYYIFYDQINL